MANLVSEMYRKSESKEMTSMKSDETPNHNRTHNSKRNNGTTRNVLPSNLFAMAPIHPKLTFDVSFSECRVLSLHHFVFVTNRNEKGQNKPKASQRIKKGPGPSINL